MSEIEWDEIRYIQMWHRNDEHPVIMAKTKNQGVLFYDSADILRDFWHNPWIGIFA